MIHQLFFSFFILFSGPGRESEGKDGGDIFSLSFSEAHTLYIPRLLLCQ